MHIFRIYYQHRPDRNTESLAIILMTFLHVPIFCNQNVRCGEMSSLNLFRQLDRNGTSYEWNRDIVSFWNILEDALASFVPACIKNALQ